MSASTQGARGRVADGLRLTPQRLAILEVLRGTASHPDADWVHREVRRKLPHISLGTVYRNLAELARAGLIQELVLGQASHWDGRVAAHEHLVCVRCGRVTDVELPVLSVELDRAAAQVSGYAIRGHHLQFTGLCPDCAALAPDPYNKD